MSDSGSFIARWSRLKQPLPWLVAAGLVYEGATAFATVPFFGSRSMTPWPPVASGAMSDSDPSVEAPSHGTPSGLIATERLLVPGDEVFAGGTRLRFEA